MARTLKVIDYKSTNTPAQKVLSSSVFQFYLKTLDT